MADYKDRRNYADGSINNSVIALDGEHVAEGVDMFEVEMDEDSFSINKVADGLGNFQENPSKSGQFRINLHEGSATNTWLWGKWKDKASFSVDHVNEAKPEYYAGAKHVRIMKQPVESQQLEGQVIEWVLVAVYLDYEGGGFKLVS